MIFYMDQKVMLLKNIRKEFILIVLLLGLYSSVLSQVSFVSIGSEMGSFSNYSDPYITYTYGQFFAADVDSVESYTLGVQQAYLIETDILDTICQEADSSIRYQLHGFDLPLHTAGNVLGENYVPVGSFLNYDTVGRITLTIHPIYFVSDTLLVYDSQMPFTFNDTTFSTEGTHTIVLPTIHGCDSTIDVMLYVATCPQDTQLVAAYSVCDVAAFPLSAPVVVPSPIPMSNNSPQRYMVGDTTPVLWTLSIAGQYLNCTQNVFVAFPPCGDNFYAYDGNGTQYNTVRVGCHCWTRENLSTTRYTDGTEVPTKLVYYAQMYPDTTQNLLTYGRLYDWYSALRLPVGFSGTVSDTLQGVCPEGWHIPTNQQFLDLTAFQSPHLKTTNLWIVSGTNQTGFSSVPGGYYNYVSDHFYNLAGNAYYWTAAIGDERRGQNYQISYSCENGYIEDALKDYAYSVRCIKN